MKTGLWKTLGVIGVVTGVVCLWLAILDAGRSEVRRTRGARPAPGAGAIDMPGATRGGKAPAAGPAAPSGAVDARRDSMAPDGGGAPREQPRALVTPEALQAAARRVDWFRDTGIPLEQRMAEIRALGRKGDVESRAALMALGDARVYVNRHAVEALGQCLDGQVRTYLEGKLADPDAMVASAAIRALAAAGEEAIPALAGALERNHQRADGYQEVVCIEAVKALALTASPKAAPVLIAELGRPGEAGWSLDYGSAILAALRNTSGAEGRTAAGAYADRLTARMPSEPMARRYYEDKIAEARATAGRAR